MIEPRSVPTDGLRSTARGTALITGASSGIGAAFARHLAVQGWDLVLVARREARLRALADLLETAVELLVADLSLATDLDRIATRASGDDVALLINCAGINGFGPAHQVTGEMMAHVIAVNVTAPTLLTRSALAGMLARDVGTIINVSSRLAFGSTIAPAGLMPHRGVYAGTKGYLVTFTRTLESEISGSQVRLQVLCPPLTATEFHLTDGAATVTADPVVPAGMGMAADDVVRASLAALETGETVCLPSLADPAPLANWAAAEAAVFSAAAGPLAGRYGG